MRISDGSSDVCSSDLAAEHLSFSPSFEFAVSILPTVASRTCHTICERVSAGSAGVDGTMVTPICSAMAQSSARRHKISQMMYSYCMSAGPGSANGPANVIAEESMRSEENTSELQSLMRNSYAV